MVAIAARLADTFDRDGTGAAGCRIPPGGGRRSRKPAGRGAAVAGDRRSPATRAACACVVPTAGRRANAGAGTRPGRGGGARAAGPRLGGQAAAPPAAAAAAADPDRQRRCRLGPGDGRDHRPGPGADRQPAAHRQQPGLQGPRAPGREPAAGGDPSRHRGRAPDHQCGTGAAGDAGAMRGVPAVQRDHLGARTAGIACSGRPRTHGHLRRCLRRAVAGPGAGAGCGAGDAPAAAGGTGPWRARGAGVGPAAVAAVVVAAGAAGRCRMGVA